MIILGGMDLFPKKVIQLPSYLWYPSHARWFNVANLFSFVFVVVGACLLAEAHPVVTMALETGEEDSNQFVLQFSQRLQRRRAEKEAGYLFASLTPTNAAAAAAAAAAAGSSRTQAPPPAMSTPGLTRVDWSAVRNTELRGFKNGPSLVLDLEREDYMKREKAFLRAETDRKAREQAAAQEEQEHADSDSSAEWTREKKDRLLVENAKKHYTKSRRIKENSERCHTSQVIVDWLIDWLIDWFWQFLLQIQTIDRLADQVRTHNLHTSLFFVYATSLQCLISNQEDMGGYVDWEKMDDPDYDVLTQMSHYKPVALHIARHMDVCFPPLNKEFEVKITSYKDGSFYCNWPEIGKVTLEEREIWRKPLIPPVNDEHSGWV